MSKSKQIFSSSKESQKFLIWLKRWSILLRYLKIFIFILRFKLLSVSVVKLILDLVNSSWITEKVGQTLVVQVHKNSCKIPNLSHDQKVQLVFVKGSPYYKTLILTSLLTTGYWPTLWQIRLLWTIMRLVGQLIHCKNPWMNKYNE